MQQILHNIYISLPSNRAIVQRLDIEGALYQLFRSVETKQETMAFLCADVNDSAYISLKVEQGQQKCSVGLCLYSKQGNNIKVTCFEEPLKEFDKQDVHSLIREIEEMETVSREHVAYAICKVLESKREQRKQEMISQSLKKQVYMEDVGKIAHLCMTREAAEKFLKKVEQLGFGFVYPSGGLHWEEFKEHTCYILTRGYGILVYHEIQAKAEGYRIKIYCKK